MEQDGKGKPGSEVIESGIKAEVKAKVQAKAQNRVATEKAPVPGSPRTLQQNDRAPSDTADSLFPQADESILKNTKLLQVHPESNLPPGGSGAESEGNPWENIEPERVRLNKYIHLGYISEQSMKLVIERLYNIQTNRQKQFKRIIEEMQKSESKDKSLEYSSQISSEKESYNFNILFLDFSRYLKTLLHPPTRRILQVADLVYPQGVLMQWAFRTLAAKLYGMKGHHDNDPEKRPTYEFQTKFDFTVSLLSDLDEYHCSVFLIGSVASLLNRVEDIFKTSFNNIKILGRYTTRHGKGKNLSEIRTVINKSSPTLLLVARNANIHDFVDGKNGERRMKSFLVLDYPEALRDFSGKYRRKKRELLKTLLPISYLVFPWKWPELLCILIFLLKIFFLTLVGVKGHINDTTLGDR
ncbi:WecB/TagA/CpsF family glycosyltransferase [Candidatus Haliotispira prima]|uniref:WecB/TagA/CpsF family glycosyltransferase n=1 Tax=Candidatus Haliotispira prima TaxID=3034016 RepID=A0ABY8MKY2_9SPIO|nr:WecB/TagA/CpsF family glycosyltransferase [Candidatus Haliotispira prima]